MLRVLILLAFILPYSLLAQRLEGKVADESANPLIGASIHWLNTNNGTITNNAGEFVLERLDDTSIFIVVRSVGFIPDTINVKGLGAINIVLKSSGNLNEVEVVAEDPEAYISRINPIKTEVITQTELTKAACCDLAGCFDTQGSVRPTTTNVVTNAKELRILGLSGVYNQVLIDGMPLIQGLTYTYGISTIPGTAVENIYVAKGANSVLQGFESISGQINVELKEPDDSEKLLLNTYVNSFLETQFNVNYSHRWKKWSTILAAHTTQPALKFDRDEDTFLDLPLINRYSVYNKWKFGDQKAWGWHSRIGVRYVNERRLGGQLNFDPIHDLGTMNQYGQSVQFSQPELFTKTGYRLNDKHHFVLLASSFYHDQLSYFGTTRFKAEQLNAYANVQHEFTYNKKHALKTGLSFRYQNLDRNISFGNDTLNRTYAGDYLKSEHISGVFAENSFNWKDRDISLITGVRADYHNTFGWFITPRALFRYNITENLTARFSAGTGWRTINLFSENTNLLASSRDVIILEQLEPERALNYGANLTYQIPGEKVEANFSFDFYRTEFMNQIFPDYDSNPSIAYISNFKGQSISNGLQAEIGFEFFERIGLKGVYNYLDVYRVINGAKVLLPFNPIHRLTSTFSFKPLNKKWHFDMNFHWYGEQRLANTSSNPEQYQIAETSNPYSVLNAQFTKSWKQLEIYVGCENIFDFRQRRPILSWEEPFSPYFDTSTVWGPTRGREIYLGLRFKIK